MKSLIQPARSLHGTLAVPPDKSISHRALLIGAVSRGKTRVTHCLQSADVETTRQAIQSLGVPVSQEGEILVIEGCPDQTLQAPRGNLEMGNSGTTTRLLLGLLAGHPFAATLVGDASLSERPMRRVTEPLERMGALFSGPGGTDRLPLTIQGGRLHGIRYPLPVASAQVKSALLLAALYAQGPTTVVEPIPTRDHTERMLEYFGARLTRKGSEITLSPGSRLEARSIDIPSDFSSAAFFLVAGMIVPDSSVTVRQVGLNPTRTGLLELLRKMNATIAVTPHSSGSGGEPVGEVTASFGPLKGIQVETASIPGVIDELPILMVAATQAEGLTRIEGAGELRVKETDRIHSMATQLNAMGARIRSEQETILIEGPTRLRGTTVSSFGDHRTAMALAVAGLSAAGATLIEESQWVEISFPDFFKTLLRLTGS